MPSYNNEYTTVAEVNEDMEKVSTNSRIVKMSFVAAAALAVSSVGAYAVKGPTSMVPAMAPQMVNTEGLAPQKGQKGKVINPDEWKQRADVMAMNALKVVYGDMSKDEVWNMFKKFQADFNRDYSGVSDSEEDERFIMFKRNLVTIDALNRQNPLAKFGITEATDKTEEEKSMRRMSGKVSDYDTMLDTLPKSMVEAAQKGPEHVVGKSFDIEDDSILGASTGAVDDDGALSLGQVKWADEKQCAACDRFPGFKDYTSDNRPTDFDWRDLGAVTGVKNQKYCGSCWTFSVAADLEGTHYLAGNDLVSLSEQQLVACDTKMYGCDGGYMYAAMQYVVAIGGMVSDTTYPYKGVMMDYHLGTPDCEVDVINSALRINNQSSFAHAEGWQFVAMGSDYEDLMATVMLKNGPLSLAINANGMDYYEFGITGCETIAGTEYCEAGSIDDTTPCDPTELDHGVVAVAYGAQNGTAYWVIKNSWATEWGEDGYYRIERGSNHCGLANMVQHTVYKDSGVSNVHTNAPSKAPSTTTAPTSEPTSEDCGKGCTSSEGDDMGGDQPGLRSQAAKQGAFRG